MEPIDARADLAATQIVDSAYAVHKTLGPGLLESVYEICLMHELGRREVLGLLINFNVQLIRDGIKRIAL